MIRALVVGAGAAAVLYIYINERESPMKLPVLSTIMTPMFRRMMAFTAGGDPAKDCTQPEVAEMEEKAWKDVEGKDWRLYQKMRPYNLKSFTSKAPANGSVAPDGPALTLAGKPTSLLAEVKALGAANGAAHVAVLFDSLTCPIWRTFAGVDLTNAAYGLPVLHVYVLEAHAVGEFDTPPLPPPVQIKEEIKVHSSEEERAHAAGLAKALLEAKVGGEVAMILDSMSNELERAYEARPFRAYVIEVATSKVAFASGPGPFNVNAKVTGLKAFAKSVLS
mmetsp:Transcript_15067/g.50019  ORF Transcript_15067/g.50019 Transcript_15067/m.50019 type:complete len:278 (-) Transcript_15067:75-908(-)|eukprot:CAMPEP_0202782198 /NCGR_PEP_ID=MMETSP1388-20130828/62168_1 /ASSEMBLY_ACC=CAM_ASM_000864 /TAXON_ID=37098 /ORGANISM="Isochrysis sp, Strain CCMP1244" /LENGTH=277 /DNA_ID=CAMNT_0049451629 /DNA_START=106 /DNA_END=939 /DNA_ORIENTATION=-